MVGRKELAIQNRGYLCLVSHLGAWLAWLRGERSAGSRSVAIDRSGCGVRAERGRDGSGGQRPMGWDGVAHGIASSVFDEYQLLEHCRFVRTSTRSRTYEFPTMRNYRMFDMYRCATSSRLSLR
eukprot:4326789-Pleurochrysis_carterae.AAC.5